MNSDSLKKYIESPNLLNKSSISELELLLNEYPYFQTAWALYAKNLFLTEDVRFKNKIKQAALHCPNRLMLYKLIKEDFTPVIKLKKEQKLDDSINLIAESNDIPQDIDLNNLNEDSDDLLEFAFETIILASPSNDEYINVAQADIPSKEIESKIKSKNRELLDKFIADKPKIIPRDTEYAITTATPGYQKEDSDELITETLAQIYIKQGHYDKALLTYEKLSLKYPEKSIYFATQIKMINELKEKNS